MKISANQVIFYLADRHSRRVNMIVIQRFVLFVLIPTQKFISLQTASLDIIIWGTPEPASVSLQSSANFSGLWSFESLPYNQTLTK